MTPETHRKIVQNICLKAKDIIDLIPAIPTYDFSYWKGYCTAAEEFNGIGKGDIWHPVQMFLNSYCEQQRSKSIFANAKSINFIR